LSESPQSVSQGPRYRALWLSAWVPVLLIVVTIVVAATVSLESFSFDAIAPEAKPAIGTIIGIVAVAGVGACAVVEAAKRLLAVRGLFQAHALYDWMRLRATAGNPRDAFSQLIAVMGIPSKRGVYQVEQPVASRRPTDPFVIELFDVPMEQLAAQLAQAASYALNHRADNGALLHVIAGIPEVGIKDPSREKTQDTKEPALDGSAAADAASFRAQQSVDNFQIVIGRRWRRWLTVAAMMVSGLLGSALAIALLEQGFVLAILLSIFGGGLIAWTTRDLTAGIARWRHR
jgi:hypothetical protein